MLIQRPARAWASLRPPVRRAVICARAPQRSAHRRRAIGERSGPATDSKQLREHRACIFVNRRYYRREETDQQWNYTIACYPGYRIVLVWPPAPEPGTGRIVHVSRPDEPGAAGRIRTGTTRARSRFSNVADYWTRRCAAARIACAFLHRLSDLICSVSKRQPSPFIGV